MTIEITIIKGNAGQFSIDLDKETRLATLWVGFKNAELIFKAVSKKSYTLGMTCIFDTLEDAEFVAREYLKSLKTKNVKTIKL